MIERVTKPIYLLDPYYNRTAAGKRFKGLCDYVHDHANAIIAKRMQALDGESCSVCVCVCVVVWLWLCAIVFCSGLTCMHWAGKSAEDVGRDAKTAGGTGKKLMDFLDTLLMARDGAGKPLDAQFVRDQVDTFLFAGEWSLVCLHECEGCCVFTLRLG